MKESARMRDSFAVRNSSEKILVFLKCKKCSCIGSRRFTPYGSDRLAMRGFVSDGPAADVML